MSDGMGQGYNWESSLPLPSWPDDPRPHDSSCSLLVVGVVVVNVRRS